MDFRSRRHHDTAPVPRIRKITAFPDAGFLNGVATLDGRRGLVLMADSFKGGIWRLNMFTGEKALIFTDPSMAGTAKAQNGINGIRVRPGELYFINSALGTMNCVPIDPATGAKCGNATIITDGLAAPDDFEIDDGEGVRYLCNGFLNQVLKSKLASGHSDVLVELPGPTSVRWGSVRQAKRLFASTIGGLLQ